MGQKLAKDVVAAQDIDFEGEEELLCGGSEDGAASCDTRVVDLQQMKESADARRTSLGALEAHKDGRVANLRDGEVKSASEYGSH